MMSFPVAAATVEQKRFIKTCILFFCILYTKFFSDRLPLLEIQGFKFLTLSTDCLSQIYCVKCVIDHRKEVIQNGRNNATAAFSVQPAPINSNATTMIVYQVMNVSLLPTSVF